MREERIGDARSPKPPRLGMAPRKRKELQAATGYWFLGQPYTYFCDGREASYFLAHKAADRLDEMGIEVYSPICEMHGAVDLCGRDPLDSKRWMRRAAKKRAGAYGLLVYKLEGWELSSGLFAEQSEFTLAGKPVQYLDPEELQ